MRNGPDHLPSNGEAAEHTAAHNHKQAASVTVFMK